MGMGPGGKVALHFLNVDKTERKPPVEGAFVKFFSTSRKDRLKIHDPQDPSIELGSKDWLTDVLLADTESGLAKLKPDMDFDAQSTFSSRHVHLQYEGINPKTGERMQGEEKDAVVIAPKKAIVPQGNGKSTTNVLEVYPSGTSFADIGGVVDLI